MKKEVIREINVEKLNICEPNGEVKMTLFNSQNIPSLILEYEDLLPGHRSKDGISGIMFYNNEGDECGGLIYGSGKDEDGKPNMGMSLTFDKYKQDQVVQLHLSKNGEQQRYGFSIYDRPDHSVKESLETLRAFNKEEDQDKKKELLSKLRENNNQRIFVGSGLDGTPGVSLFDKHGKEKIKIFVDDNDNPVIKVNGKEIDILKLL